MALQYIIINFIHRKVEKENTNIYNIHKYSVSNNMKKNENKEKKLVTEHGIENQF